MPSLTGVKHVRSACALPKRAWRFILSIRVRKGEPAEMSLVMVVLGVCRNDYAVIQCT